MKRSTFISLILIAELALLLLGIYFISTDGKSSAGWSSRWNHDVTVKGHVADPKESVCEFTVEKEDEYTLNLDWNLKDEGHDLTKASEPGNIGFVTACVITDSSGEMIYSTAASAVYLDTKISMVPGLYKMTFTYLTTEKEYISFAKKYLCSEQAATTWAKEFDFSTLPENGSWSIDYSMKVSDSSSFSFRLLIGILAILISVCSALLLLLTVVSKNKKAEVPQYDERQEVERGRAFKYGFFTTLFFSGGVIIFDWCDGIPGQNQTILYCLGLFLGIMVYGSYCVWHESYIALNQKANTTMIIFAVIGLINLVLGILSIARGRMIVNGRISEHFLNFICAAMLLILCGEMLVKKIYDKKHGDASDDEE